jgi:hypothetical protein
VTTASATLPADRPAEFQALWCATDLGAYRPCGGTYQWYPHDSLPPLPAGRLDGGFGWLGGPGAALPEPSALLARVQERLAAAGLALPADFVAFQTGENSCRTLDQVSVTACWTDVALPVPSPVEPGAYLVRFLRDQQDCVLWYLYLRPSGEVFVVGSPLDFDCLPEWDEADGPVDLSRLIAWCAPTFEEFAYRFWVENRLWSVLADGGAVGDHPELAGYLAHYGRA